MRPLLGPSLRSLGSEETERLRRPCGTRRLRSRSCERDDDTERERDPELERDRERELDESLSDSESEELDESLSDEDEEL